MQIGHFVAENAHLQDNVKLEHSKSIEKNMQIKSPKELSSLKEGTVFKGEITELNGDKVKIALDNQSELMARLQGDVKLGIGDRLLFSVKENTSNQILIKPLFESLQSAQTQVLERALDMAGLSSTEKNFSAAKELMEAGLPVDKGSLVKLLSQSMRFEGTSLRTLVTLNKMGIPVTQDNISQLEHYQNGTHQLTSNIGQAADSMASFTDAFPEGTPGQTLLSAAKELLKLTASDPARQAGTEQGNMVKGEQSVLSGETVPGSETESFAVVSNGDAYSDSGLPADSSVVQESVPRQVEGSDVGEPEKLTQNQRRELLQVLEQSGISREEGESLLSSTKQPEELLQDIFQAMEQLTERTSLADTLLASPVVKKLFSDLIRKRWSLNPKQMRNPSEIDSLYNRIEKQARAFETMISSKGGDSGSFSQNFQNLRQNLQFMEQLNQQMIYAQMPVRLSNKNTNAELYVYADRKKLMKKTDGISVMLHLDMDHLGRTDVKVTLTGSNVHARFYLQDQESVEIVAGNMTELAKQLADRGFSLTNEVVKRTPQESVNKVVDEIIDENAERSIKRYTFDARM